MKNNFGKSKWDWWSVTHADEWTVGAARLKKQSSYHLLALNPYDSPPSDSDDNAHDAENKW